MSNSKKVNLNDKKFWSKVDWSEPIVIPALKKTDAQVNIARANRLKADDPAIKAKLSASTQQVLKNPEKVRIRNEAARRGGNTKANSEEYQKLMTEINQKKALDPQFSKNVSKGIQKKLKDPEYQKSRRAGNDKKRNNPLYKAKMTEVNRKKAENPEFANNVRKGIKDKWEYPEYRAKQEKAKEVRMKPCTNSKGEVFPSRTYAAKAYNVDPRVMGNWIKKGKDGWRYL
jgi:hypothetical protein